MEQPFRLLDITSIETAGTQQRLASQLDHMLQSSTSWNARVSRLNVETGEYEVVLRGAIEPVPELLEETTLTTGTDAPISDAV